MNKDTECVRFLQWALPRLALRWPGFRKVRGQVCKRLRRRLRSLALDDLTAYQVYLAQHPDEWLLLDSFCRISISRFYRDRAVFDCLAQTVLPTLAEMVSRRGEERLRCWSIGCASGEEPYTLNLIWQFQIQPQFPKLQLHITATEADAGLLQRAQTGCYPARSLRELPATWRDQAFDEAQDLYCLKEPFRRGIRFRKQDVRVTWPDSTFHLILCRNLVLTYFENALQTQVMIQIAQRLDKRGALVIGSHEVLPENRVGLRPWFPRLGIFRKPVA